MIGALTSSSSSPSSSTKPILQDFPGGISRFTSEIFFLVPRKTFNAKLLHFESAHNRVLLRPCPSSFSSKAPASQVNLDATEVQVQDKWPTKTVHVRFQLQKECVFGEHFFLVGDDPMFGLWDPENAIPLNWSDGHFWTVNLDLPVGKSLEFKFILKGKTGIILWQPGPNRALETWETSNTIVICEDWQNSELQRIFEEELVSVNREGHWSLAVNSEAPIAAESVTSTDPKENSGPESNKSSIAEEETKVVGTVQEIKDGSEVNLSFDVPNKIEIDSSDETPAVLDENAAEAAVVTEEEGPVLVPGLTPLSAFEKEEASGGGHKKPSSAHVLAEAIEGRAEEFPEVIQVDKEDQESEKETEQEERSTERLLLKAKEEEGLNRVEQRHMETDVLEKDIQWGRRTLHKLLNSFGLL